MRSVINSCNPWSSIFPRSQTDSDTEAALKELDKKCNNVDTPHVRRLLYETFIVRRSWIEKEATEISSIVAKYPQLAVYDLIIFEFITLKKITLETLLENVNAMIGKLSAHYCANEAITEKSKASVLVKLHEELANKKIKKTVNPLFIVKEVIIRQIFSCIYVLHRVGKVTL
ncbi:PREDICTED: uncharacterized protein LOC105555677 [Vollenhovia emeryi]|uniref:uncharacterized protein LOC105555677 n=1 Tax=Vollenhovia emeryi TaxID=411798 RepID=UPI0005F497C4|nr:PREDICTED: uncharacterized protein LOC105555677 [Vollenhovia emeryi]